jgi:hypothetical protein
MPFMGAAGKAFHLRRIPSFENLKAALVQSPSVGCEGSLMGEVKGQAMVVTSRQRRTWAGETAKTRTTTANREQLQLILPKLETRYRSSEVKNSSRAARTPRQSDWTRRSNGSVSRQSPSPRRTTVDGGIAVGSTPRRSRQTPSPKGPAISGGGGGEPITMSTSVGPPGKSSSSFRLPSLE